MKKKNRNSRGQSLTLSNIGLNSQYSELRVSDSGFMSEQRKMLYRLEKHRKRRNKRAE